MIKFLIWSSFHFRFIISSWVAKIQKVKQPKRWQLSLPVCLRFPLSRTHLNYWASWGTPALLLTATNEPSLPLRVIAVKPWWASHSCAFSRKQTKPNVHYSQVCNVSPLSLLSLFLCRTAPISPVWGSCVWLGGWIVGRAQWSRSARDSGRILSCRSVSGPVILKLSVDWCFTSFPSLSLFF